MEQENNKWLMVHSHLLHLIRHTMVTPDLLSFLHLKDVLSSEEIEMIVEEKAEVEKAARLYELLERKPNSYPVFIQGLHTAGQDDILDILERGQVSRQLSLAFFHKMDKLVEEGEKKAGDVIQLLTSNWFKIIWNIGEDTEHGMTALRLLFAMAYLTPGKISREVLLRHPGVGKEAAQLDAGLRLLLKYCLLDIDKESEEEAGEDDLLQGPFSLHPLLQKLTRSDLLRLGEEHTVLQDVWDMLLEEEKTKDGAGAGGGVTRLLSQKNYGHMLLLMKHLGKYPDLIQKSSYQLIP